MPKKYKSLIPLLEGEEFDYSNSLNFTDDAIPNEREGNYFEVSTGYYDPDGESPSLAENIQRALSCYQLRTSGTQAQSKGEMTDASTSGYIVSASGNYYIPGRYECRVMLPKDSSSQFEFRLYGRYEDGTRCGLAIMTPTRGESDIYNNIEIICLNSVTSGNSSKVCTISKNLNDGNFHTIGFDWYYSENNKCIKFFIDNTEIGTLKEKIPNSPMLLYIGSQPHKGLSSQGNNFEYDYAEVDYIRFTAFANQSIDTTKTIKEDTQRGGTITSTISDNIVIPRIIKTKDNSVISKTTKEQQEVIVRNINNNGNKWTLDTNGNRNGYSYGNSSTTLYNKLIIPTSVDATVDNKKANYPVIQNNARAKLKSITGNSIVWNQLCSNFKETINGQLRQCWYQDGGTMTITEEDGEQVATLMASDPTGVTFRLRPYRISADGTSNQDLMRNLPPRYHKVLFKFDARAEGTDTYDWGNWLLYICNYDANNPRFTNTMKSGEWTTFEYIQELTLGDMTSCFFNPSVTWTSGLEGKDIGYSMRRVMVFDLTLMFGKGNEPTIEEFNRVFPNTYYPWVAEGELKSTKIQSIKSYNKGGNELDSIENLSNIELISAPTNSKYHQSIEVSSTINLNAYTYDGAETYKIDKISNVSNKDLSTLGFSPSANNENVYNVWNDSIDSCYSASDYPPSESGTIAYGYPYAPILSNKYNNGISSGRMASPSDNTTYNKFISFGDNENTFYIKDNSITTDMKLYLNNIKGKTMKYTQLVNPANYPDTQTISGVTFTVNKTTGVILVNGTATEDIALKINDKTGIPFVPTSMLCLKGCPSGGSTSTYYLSWVNANYNDVGNGDYSKLNTHISLTDTTSIYLSIQIIIKSGATVNNKRFYPQLFNVSDMYGLGKEPLTIADFKKDFPYSFYPYSNREIRSVAIKQISIKPGYKNLVDKSKFGGNVSQGGVTCVNNGDGTWTINGTVTTENRFNLNFYNMGSYYIPYYLSADVPIEHNYYVQDCYYDKEGGWLYYYLKENTTYTDFVIKPEIVNLTLTYGSGNEPTTVAQFQADFPNIDDIPYAEQKITFASPITLNGINTAQDVLKIVKDNYQYSLVKEENVSTLALGVTTVANFYKSAESGHKYFQLDIPDIKNSSSYQLTNVLMSKYTTSPEPNVYSNQYNLTMSAVPSNRLMIYDKDAYDTMTATEFVDSLSGQTLYYERKTPVTTTLYSLTPSNVAALFAKGYYIEVVGNNVNKDIVRPDVTVNIPCLNGTSYIDKEVTFTNLDKEAIDGKMTGLTYNKQAIFRKELQGIHAYYGAKNTTTTELLTNLNFDDISLQIAEDGYIEVEYTGFAPNISFDFPVQLYRIYEASYGKVDVVALDSQLQNAKYNTSLQLDTIKGRSVKWTQLVDKSNLRDTTTINGVTFTIDKTNGIITVNGTATEDISCGIYPDGAGLHVLGFPQDYVYLKGCPSGGSASTYYLRWANAGKVEDFGSGYYNKLSVFTDTTDVYCNPEIIIKSGTTMTNKIFRPQLFNVSDIYGLGKEPATIADFNKDYPYSIYPYGKQEILTTKVSGIKIRAGYKNLIKNALATISNATKNGVTFTVDKTNGTITANGTASADTTFYCGYVTYKITDFGINNTSIKTFVRGCPTGGSTSTYRLRNDWLGAFDIGIGNISTLSERNPNTTIYLSTTIMIASGTTCNNLVFKPQLIDLTNTYGAGNEPTVAQFNQDYPDIDNIPYPDTEITFDEQTLYGINDAQDTLQVVKEDNGYKLQKVENIGLYDLSNSTTYYKESDENHKFFAINVPNIKVATSTIIGNILFANYITDSQTHVYNNLYNLTIATAPSQNNGVIIYNKDKWESMTAEEFKNSLSGQTLYYALVTPVTTTLATLTKSQVTALFAKGYCVEIMGNDDNRIIVRPDLTIKYNGEIEETTTQSNDTESEVVE